MRPNHETQPPSAVPRVGLATAASGGAARAMAGGPAPGARARAWGLRPGRVLVYGLLAVGALTFVYPFLWMLGASLATEDQLRGLVLFPAAPTLDNYRAMVERIPIWRALANSLLVSGLVTAGVLALGSLVGYALATMRFRGRRALFYVLLFTMTLPFQITLIPNYIVIVELGWVDTYWALVVPFLMNAFAILLFRQAFRGIPRDLIDAARVDGAGHLRILYTLLWPNVMPTLITVAILTFMSTWNEVLWPLIVVRDEAVMTLPQLVTLFAVGGRADGQLGVKLAAAVTLALPIVVAYLFAQRHFISSMASSGLKD